MRVNVFAFGKMKTPGLREAADYYQRLSRIWIHLEEIELKPLPVPEKQAETRLRIQEKEGQLLRDRLQPRIKGRSFFILLDEGGKEKSTQKWAADLRKWEDSGIPEISYCIGSSLGFSDELRKQAHEIVSLGPQTVSHELARVVLLEQLFRAFSVLKGHPYHNEG